MPEAAPAVVQQRLAAYTGAREDIASLVPWQALHILDLGCSDGSLGLGLKQQRPERRVCGIEYSSELAARAASRLDEVHEADLSRTDALEQLSRKDFDCIICADVLEHLQQPERLLEQLHGLLRPGGVLVVSLPNIRHLSALRAIFLQGSFPRRPRGIFDDSHWRWFTVGDGRRLLEQAGYALTDSSYTLRWGDQGGGRANRLLNRWFGRHAGKIPPVREFLSYQFAMRARSTRSAESPIDTPLGG
ncbi:methyltransferase domain-containing protein [Pelomonas sp. V22]|uniref:class I SAM-dependent methyltransferase n=1 Tax=Pelomonas sp. V22 TaxID=2822139 RepID=UPI0024A8B577|nr:class I SAM-dependent methyltransferase [Pelomonas sp. V22]MDI4631695.1 methyltransferase domain-containing protein [Pelomonas sp. V22]